MIQIGSISRMDDLCGEDPPACIDLDVDRGSKPEITVAQIFIRHDVTTDTYAVTTDKDSEKCSMMEQLAMHEAGHAYGLTDITTFAPSVISYSLYDYCSPTEQDIVAVKSIYQSRFGFDVD